MNSECTVRQVRPQDPEHSAVLHLALGVSPVSQVEAHSGVVDLLAHADRTDSPVELAFGAYVNGRIRGAAVGLEAPGGSALTFAASAEKSDMGLNCASKALRALSCAAWERSIQVLEGLLHPERHDSRMIYERAGFGNITELCYMLRTGRSKPPACLMAGGLTWESFSPRRESLFLAALEASYVQSLDCPELTGLRSTADVLKGHMASGDFDPALWWVAMLEREPAGVILLNRFPQRDALELAYMGVAQAFRGKGVANALLNRAVAASEQFGANYVALAVDGRNTPALRMYTRWSFVETMKRNAWILANSPSAIGCDGGPAEGGIGDSFPHSQHRQSQDGA